MDGWMGGWMTGGEWKEKEQKPKRGWERGTLASWKRNSQTREPTLFYFWSSAYKLCDPQELPSLESSLAPDAARW